MNFQVPKCVICVKSDIDFRCIVFNAHLSILQVIGHSMRFSQSLAVPVVVHM